MKKRQRFWYTLIEMIIVVALLAIILIATFESMLNISTFRVKVSNRLDIEQDLYYSIETIATTIKDFWWKIDFEEYFNRQVIWVSTWSWHYSNFSWYWNYWNWWNPWTWTFWGLLYNCFSINTIKISNWCFLTWSINTKWTSLNWEPQRYWQYKLQFIDYNSNQDADNWDEDWINWIIWDEDDENIWQWPESFTWTDINELYLIKSWKTNERLYLRLKIIKDPNAWSLPCNFPAWTWSWCLWKLQILKLAWKDYWNDHDKTTNDWDWSFSDWIIDTWLCNKEYCWNEIILPNIDAWWIDLLPSYVNVKNIKLKLYPNKNSLYSWNEDSQTININPYIKLNLTIGYSVERRSKLKWIDPQINISTTINLSE